ncbi:hypothetical protein [Jatrophihabitans fulvus]
MHAQIAWFDGPRSPELVAAAEYAGTRRVVPALMADPQCAAGHVGTFVLRSPDGGEMVVVLTESEAVLDRAGQIIMSTPLHPGEDLALLPGPDRVSRHAVAYAVERARVTHDATGAPSLPAPQA